MSNGPINKVVGEMFSFFRAAEGLTQKQAARQLGTSAAQVSYLENGKGNLMLETLVKYAKAYGYDVSISFNERSED